MPRRDPLPPDVARELEDLDAALAGAPGADPELTALVTDVRAARPEPGPAFLASLDAKVLEGFGAPGGAPSRRRLPRLRVWAPLMGATAAALVLVVVLVAGNGSTGGGDNASSGGGGSVAASDSGGARETAKDSGGGAGPTDQSSSSSSSVQSRSSSSSSSVQSGSSTATPAPPLAPGPSGPSDALGRTRRVERSAELVLAPPPDAVQDVADGVVRSTQAIGGYVAQSQVQA